MLKLEIDIDGLNKEQRESIAGFLLTYPGKNTELAKPQPAINEVQLDGKSVQNFAAVDQSQVAPVVTLGHFSNGPDLSMVHVLPLGQQVVAQPTNAAHSNVANDVDSSGLPWDARIHASTKTKKADGTWTAKRGLEASFGQFVEQELRAKFPRVGNTSENPQTPSEMFGIHAASSIPSHEMVAAKSSYEINSNVMTVNTPVVPPPPTMVQADPSTYQQRYLDLVRRCFTLQREGKISIMELDSLCINNGVPNLPSIANRLDLVPTIELSLEALLAGR